MLWWGWMGDGKGEGREDRVRLVDVKVMVGGVVGIGGLIPVTCMIFIIAFPPGYLHATWWKGFLLCWYVHLPRAAAARSGHSLSPRPPIGRCHNIALARWRWHPPWVAAVRFNHCLFLRPLTAWCQIILFLARWRQHLPRVAASQM